MVSTGLASNGIPVLSMLKIWYRLSMRPFSRNVSSNRVKQWSDTIQLEASILALDRDVATQSVTLGCILRNDSHQPYDTTLCAPRDSSVLWTTSISFMVLE